ncbi:hypothetical protein [Pelosinus sp. sgz500959]
METVNDDQKEDKAYVEYLEDPNIVLNELKKKELLSTAMSNYYLLYR